MCNAYIVRPKISAKIIEQVISAQVLKLPSPLVRRGGGGVILRAEGDEWIAETMRWGFPHPVYKLVNNARSESLKRKRGMWVESLAERRCLVPMSAFYEWQKITDKTKLPYEFRLPDDDWMWIPGLYQRTVEGPSYATITTEPTSGIAPIHDRLLGIVDLETGLDFLRGGDPPSEPYAGEIIVERCESPLKKKKPPEGGPQPELF